VSDVLVVGGGIIGCAIARELTAAGAAVTLVEPRDVGQGASRASAGMLVPFNEGRHDRALQALGVHSLSRYDALIAALAADGELVPYSRHGSLDVALDPGGLAALDEIAAGLTADGVAFDRLDAAAAHALEPALPSGVAGGLHIAAHGAVGVPELVAALWRSASLRGATRAAARALSISQAGSRVRVETTAGVLESRRAVLAPGSWASDVQVSGAAALPVHPVRGQLLVLRTDAVRAAHTLWGPGCYVVPWPDGTLLVGATAERVGFDERATAGGVYGLLDAVMALLPASRSAELHDVRVGLRPGTPDDRPIVGASSVIEGLIYATGHYRNGALLAPATAEAVAALIGGGALDDVWDVCAPGRFGVY
jgi:glycine oxidase